MHDITPLSPELNTIIGTENRDFVVTAGRIEPLKKSLFSLFFGLAWTAFTSLFVFTFFGPLFVGEEVSFESNGVPTVASLDNLGPLIVPGVLISVFILIGLGMIGWSIFCIFRKGGIFVGTPNRLVHFRNGNLRSIDWEQFSGDIEVNGDEQKGNIALHLRTGKMVSRKNGPDRYVPDTIYLSEIPNAFEIEKICRKRIKENDPTPSSSLKDDISSP
jgi:hypothetical protein